MDHLVFALAATVGGFARETLIIPALAVPVSVGDPPKPVSLVALATLGIVTAMIEEAPISTGPGSLRREP